MNLENLINLTPNDVVIKRNDGRIFDVPPSGKLARVVTIGQFVDMFDGVEIVTRIAGGVEGIPDDGGSYIVSATVLESVPNKVGVYAPDTGDTAGRDQFGNILFVTRLFAA